MRSALGTVSMAFVLAAGVAAARVSAQDKALPTLLIKGEVVSVDTTDPAASLLKVKDRYGFETPIFLSPDTKILQGEAAATPASLTTGAPVEVEYNFDVNTAKRHAVSVKVAATVAAAESPAATPPAAEQPDAPAAAELTAAPAEASPAAPTDASSAPTEPPAPATSGKQPAPATAQ